MSDEKRVLIETFLPVEEISDEAKIEKIGAARPPISSMHYWWTRKPLIACRAAVLGALLPENYDIQDFKRLLGLDLKGRAHKHDISPEKIGLLKREYEKIWGTPSPNILDPFAGGGSISFEAMRIGANTIAIDYNPVAYLIEKATLDYPNRYGDKILKDVKKGLCWIIKKTKDELEEYYPKYEGNDVLVYLWAWMVKCTSCGFDNPLVGQWWLSDKKKIYLFPSVINGNLELIIKRGDDAPEGNCSNGKGVCLSCGSVISNDIVKNDIRNREKEKILVVITPGKKSGYEYNLPSIDDLNAFKKATDDVTNAWDDWVTKGLIPLQEMPVDTRGAIWAKNYLTYWHKLLNPRQKLLFVTLLKNIIIYGKQISEEHNEEYGAAVATYLSFIFGKHIDYNCRSTTLNRQRIMAHALTSRGISMAWDHAEVNPFVDSCGSLIAMSRNILDGLEYSIEKLKGKGHADIYQNSITKLDKKTDLIITDPPYFDDIQYAELSEFFYMWEKKALESFFNLGDVPKSEDMSVGGNNRTSEFFEKLFRLSCNKMHTNLTENGLLIMFFAHSSPEAWDFVIKSLQNAGFRITATWPIHTESTSNPLARGHSSLMSSIIIVARKRKADKYGYIEEIKEEVEAHLKGRLDEFWKYGLRGADLTVSAMGATLDVITQYSEIKSYTGDMSIKDVLELVQRFVAEYVLSRYIKNTSGLDPQTSFYLYSRLSDLNGMPFDTANLISKSLNVNLKQFEKEGLIKSIDKGKAKGIQILKYNERNFINTDPKSLIDAVHLVMAEFEKGGFADADKQMERVRYSRNEIKDILVAFLSLEPEDPERQISMKILERTEQSFPKSGQRGLDDF